MRQQVARQNLIRRPSQLIGWCFGTFWALLGTSAVPHPFTGPARAVAIAMALFFLVRLWRHGSSAVTSKSPFKSWPYLLAVVAEVLGMYAAAFFLPRFGAKQQVYPVVGFIVGLHFIGLWLATRSLRFLHIIAGMCSVSLLSMVIPYTWHGIGTRYFLLGTGNAIVLWLAASSKEQ